MFERFTDQARACIVLAQEEARELHHGHIGTEHVLLGLAREQQGLGGRVLRELGVTHQELRDALPPGAIDRDALASIGIDFDEVRRRVEETFGPGSLEAGRPRKGHIPFTPKSKKSLELALRTAVHMGDNFIGSEHLLLGIARVEEDVGARMLAARGLTRDRLEAAIEDARRAA